MPRAAPPLLPRLSRLLEAMGSNLKLARLRRKFSAETVAQRAGISRKTMYRVEQGDPAVALGIYARVLQAWGWSRICQRWRRTICWGGSCRMQV